MCVVFVVFRFVGVCVVFVSVIWCVLCWFGVGAGAGAGVGVGAVVSGLVRFGSVCVCCVC